MSGTKRRKRTRAERKAINRARDLESGVERAIRAANSDTWRGKADERDQQMNELQARLHGPDRRAEVEALQAELRDIDRPFGRLRRRWRHRLHRLRGRLRERGI